MKPILQLILLLLVLLPSLSLSQNSITERTRQLEQQVETTTGEAKIKAYLNLLDYLIITQPIRVKEVSEAGIKFARNIGDQSSEAKMILALGVSYSKLNQPKQALIYYQDADNIAKKISDSLTLCKVLIRSGAAKISTGGINFAIEEFIKAENIALKINDKYCYIDAINYLGIAYYLIENYTESINFSKRALKLSDEISYLEGKALSYEHLAIVKIKLKEFEEALSYNSNAVEIRKAQNDLPSLAGGYYNFAIIYNQLKQFDKAISFTKQSIEIRKSINNINGVGSNYQTLGNIYLNSNQVDSALTYLKRAYEIKIGTGDTRSLTTIVRGLSEAYERKEDFSNAFKFLKLFKAYNDSIAGDDAKRISAKILAQQEFVRKESEIKHLQNINSFQKKIQLFLIVIILLATLLITMLIIFFLKNKKINRELVNKNKLLSTLNRDRDRFLRIIAHDLRSPFHPILGYTDLLTSDERKFSQAEVKELATIINISTRKIFDLLNNLLEWLGMNAGKIEIKAEKFNINDEINNVIKLFNSSIRLKQLSISSNLKDDLIIEADRYMVGTILRNIFSNAIKFSKENGQIIITAISDAEFVNISIMDNGIGMSEYQLSVLFTDDLISTPGTGKENGSGLGLILCKEMVEKHGGKISINSKLEDGTSVVISLKKYN